MTIPPLVPPGYALIFDMDGVVIDSNDLHAVAWERYLARHGVSGSDLERRMLGKRNDQIVRDLLGGHLTDDEVFEHGAAKEALYRELMAPLLATRMTPGLSALLDRAGCPLGMATNAEPPNVRFVLDGMGLASRFQAVVNGHQVTQPKPHPEVYLRVASLLGVPPSRCVVFEDSPTGAAAAHAAGARVVGVKLGRENCCAVSLTIENFLDPSLDGWLREQTVSH